MLVTLTFSFEYSFCISRLFHERDIRIVVGEAVRRLAAKQGTIASLHNQYQFFLPPLNLERHHVVFLAAERSLGDLNNIDLIIVNHAEILQEPTQLIPWHNAIMEKAALIQIHSRRPLFFGLLPIPWVHSEVQATLFPDYSLYRPTGALQAAE
jgi:hypothetical protein